MKFETDDLYKLNLKESDIKVIMTLCSELVKMNEKKKFKIGSIFPKFKEKKFNPE
jgi:hypothetical protein